MHWTDYIAVAIACGGLAALFLSLLESVKAGLALKRAEKIFEEWRRIDELRQTAELFMLMENYGDAAEYLEEGRRRIARMDRERIS